MTNSSKDREGKYDKDYQVLNKEDKKLYKHKSLKVENVVFETKPSQQECSLCGEEHLNSHTNPYCKCDRLCEPHNPFEKVTYKEPPKSSDVELEQRFWLMWGVAPAFTPKYKKGVEVLGFIKDLLSQQQKEVEERVRREMANHILHILDEGNNQPIEIRAILRCKNIIKYCSSVLTSIEEKGGRG